jgi:hypothetical protein
MAVSNQKIRVVVDSRRVATGVISYDVLLLGPFGRMYSVTKQTTVYERVLDEDQSAMLSEARRFSSASGIDLEVIDLGKKNFVARFVWDLTRRFENPPALVLRESVALQLILSKNRTVR